MITKNDVAVQKLGPGGGLNTTADPLSLAENETPDCIDVLFKEDSSLSKRKGREQLGSYLAGISSGLVAYWRLDENGANTTVYDNLGGTHNGAAQRNTNLTRGNGIFGGCYSPNGTSDYITVPDHADLSFGDGTNDSAFSIAFRLNVIGTMTQTNEILDKWDVTGTLRDKCNYRPSVLVKK